MIIDRIKNHDDPPEEHADDCQCSECQPLDDYAGEQEMFDREIEQRTGYPTDWPKCPACGLPALDGHITCGSAECREGDWR
jgi:hypothetical protein